MRIAVVGCSHGTLDEIYGSVERCDQEAKKKGEPAVELMICCGDFQVSPVVPPLRIALMEPNPFVDSRGYFTRSISHRLRRRCAGILKGRSNADGTNRRRCGTLQIYCRWPARRNIVLSVNSTTTTLGERSLLCLRLSLAGIMRVLGTCGNCQSLFPTPSPFLDPVSLL